MMKVRQIVNKDKSEEAQSPGTATIQQVLKVVFTNEDRESW